MANPTTESTPMSTIEVPVLEDGVWILGPDGGDPGRQVTQAACFHHRTGPLRGLGLRCRRS